MSEKFTPRNKFTPGPFESHDEPNWYGFESRFYEVTDKDGLIVAFIKDWSDAPTQSRENARLFSAAPELLEALHEAADYIGDRSAGSSQFWDLYDAAITKARGESCST